VRCDANDNHSYGIWEIRSIRPLILGSMVP